MADHPADGDVLITSDNRAHLISVVPHPHRISFASLQAAVQLAKRWAHDNRSAVWHSVDGTLTRIEPASSEPARERNDV
jgi:hypothetical protein